MLRCKYLLILRTFCQIISRNVFSVGCNVFSVGRKYIRRASNHILWTDEDFFSQKSEKQLTDEDFFSQKSEKQL